MVTRRMAVSASCDARAPVSWLKLWEMRLRSATTQPHYHWTGAGDISAYCKIAEFDGPQQEGPHAAEALSE